MKSRICILLLSTTVVSFAIALGGAAVIAGSTEKCWTRKQQCCYEEVVCGEECREGYGFKHCWKKLCSEMRCRDLSPSEAPKKPKDRIDWKNSTEIDCTLKPEECGDPAELSDTLEADEHEGRPQASPASLF